MLVSAHDMRLVQEIFPHTIVKDDLTMEILENEELLTAHGLGEAVKQNCGFGSPRFRKS
jgi:hypothetical protein